MENVPSNRQNNQRGPRDLVYNCGRPSIHLHTSTSSASSLLSSNVVQPILTSFKHSPFHNFYTSQDPLNIINISALAVIPSSRVAQLRRLAGREIHTPTSFAIADQLLNLGYRYLSGNIEFYLPIFRSKSLRTPSPSEAEWITQHWDNILAANSKTDRVQKIADDFSKAFNYTRNPNPSLTY